MIYARPGADFTAILDAAGLADLVGTLTVQIENADGSTHTAPTTEGIVEVEPGIYAASLAAPDDAATYIVVWKDPSVAAPAPEELIVASSLPLVAVGWRPSVADVGQTWLRARTYSGTEGALAGGLEVGTFNDETHPTGDQVEGIIDGAVREVLSHFPAGEIGEGSHLAAHHATEVYTALMIELGYFPEQSVDNSPFLQLRSLYDAALATLLANAQVQDLFGEREPEVVEP